TTTRIYTLSLHDALPIFAARFRSGQQIDIADSRIVLLRKSLRSEIGHTDSETVSERCIGERQHHDPSIVGLVRRVRVSPQANNRSEEHTSELQSRSDLVC